MISTHQRMKAYCSEPLSHIENYDKAVADDEHVWVCHHRAEVLPCGRYTVAQLQKHGLYWHRPASELIFLRRDVHTRLHRNGTHHSDEAKRKISAYLTNRQDTSTPVEMTRISDGFTKVFPSMSEAARWLKLNGRHSASSRRISECCRGRRESIYGTKWRIIHG